MRWLSGQRTCVAPATWNPQRWEHKGDYIKFSSDLDTSVVAYTSLHTSCIHTQFKTISEAEQEAGEMTQQLKLLLDLPESLSWGASIYSKQFATNCNSSLERLYTTSGLHGPPLTSDMCTHTQIWFFFNVSQSSIELFQALV